MADEEEDFDEQTQPQVDSDKASPSKGQPKKQSEAVKETDRARRRREEAVRRLVADVQARPERKFGGENAVATKESEDWIVASTVAAALERGLDRDLHSELVLEAKENSARIGQVCHDHSDLFLASVGKVVALGAPSADLANKLNTAQEELGIKTAGPMQGGAVLWDDTKASNARARALFVMVNACQKVAMWLERARKQAALGRPRGALEAVDEARTALTSPLSALFYGPQMEDAAEILRDLQKKAARGDKKDSESKNIVSLEQTPFGQRASLMLPKIENEVLMGARRGLNRWFLALRSGGDGAKAGRAVLRRCANSMAVGPGNLGLGGLVPPSYMWRAKVSDNLISRMNQNGRVVRAVRLGYWFERDAPKEAERLEAISPPGMERRAESFASAFGWYRCWDENVNLMVDPSDYASTDMGKGLSGSRHGLSGSRHGKQGSSLGFKSKGGAKGSSQVTTTASTGKQNSGSGDKSKWAGLLTPAVLFNNSPSR